MNATTFELAQPQPSRVTVHFRPPRYPSLRTSCGRLLRELPKHDVIWSPPVSIANHRQAVVDSFCPDCLDALELRA